ncbi:hypothetical protein [Pseudomonas sp. NPDC086251]|uniref:hypothetical protein n=1 Tax=Pseudomonas sp. NPDC086251 TaxID=3364431 RepID=UPI003832F111
MHIPWYESKVAKREVNGTMGAQLASERRAKPRRMAQVRCQQGEVDAQLRRRARLKQGAHCKESRAKRDNQKVFLNIKCLIFK